MMLLPNRYELAAFARFVVAIAIGASPFVALGVLTEWWIAGAVFAVAAAVACWYVATRMLTGRPW